MSTKAGQLQNRPINFAIPGVLTGEPAVDPGSSRLYSFAAPAAGSYYYCDEVNGEMSRALGLLGPLIVMPADGSNRLYAGGPAFDRQYTLVLGEYDDRLNDAVASNQSFDMADFAPNYFFVNGLSFPDTAGDTDTLIAMAEGETVALRLVNSGVITNPMHFHGYHVEVATRDRVPETVVVDKDTVLVDVGECVDLILPVSQAGTFPLHTHFVPGVTANGVYVNPYGGSLITWKRSEGREYPAMRRTSHSGQSRTFTYLGPNSAFLDVAMNGHLTMADGNVIRSWYFGNGFNEDRTVPSPVIEAIEGQTVEVILDSMMAHSIHFHGLDVDQANDGVPSTSGYVARMSGGGFGRVDGYQNLGSPFTYTFVAPHAGTYMYHCHVDTVLHLEMGMYGTVIVRPPDGSPTRAWEGGPSFDREYVWHLHTFDSRWHDFGGQGPPISGPETVRYQPDYFMINGRDGANAISDPTAAVAAAAGQRVLVRVANVGYQPALVRLGGLVFRSHRERRSPPASSALHRRAVGRARRTFRPPLRHA